MSQITKDMTAGRPAKLLLSFALPLMLGNIFQQLYTMVDTMVVGRGIGVEALAALGAVDWFNWMVLNIMIGFAQGFSILSAQFFGGGRYDDLRKSISMSVLLGALIAAAATLISQAVARPALLLLNTPPGILEQSLSYVRVSFGGILVIMAYNILSSILRALGNSKTPLFAMVVAAAINVVLDVLFVIVFRWGIASAAVATVIAQFFSCVFCFLHIRKIEFIRLKRSDWRPDLPIMRRLMRLGLPMAFQNTTIAIGGMTIQSVVNGFGVVFVAGFTATNKLYGLLELAAISFGFSLATFAGQNLGAGRLDRIRQGVREGVAMAFCTSMVISVVVICFGRRLVGLFISGDPEQSAAAVDIAYRYLFLMGSLLFILYLLHLYRSALQGMGDTVVPMLSGVAELAMRIGVVLTLPRLLGVYGVYLAEVAAWVGADLILLTAYYRRMRIHPERRDGETHA